MLFTSNDVLVLWGEMCCSSLWELQLRVRRLSIISWLRETLFSILPLSILLLCSVFLSLSISRSWRERAWIILISNQIRERALEHTIIVKTLDRTFAPHKSLPHWRKKIKIETNNWINLNSWSTHETKEFHKKKTTYIEILSFSGKSEKYWKSLHALLVLKLMVRKSMM